MWKRKALLRAVSFLWCLPLFISPAKASTVAEILDTVPGDSGWLSSSWAGRVWPGEASWYWFLDTGQWHYCQPGESSGLWRYNAREGWSWSSKEVAPFTWFSQPSRWYARDGSLSASGITGVGNKRWFALGDDFEWLYPLSADALDVSLERYKQAASEIAADQFPYQLDMQTGLWVTNGSWNWTSGFFPASLLQLYAWSGEESVLADVRQRLEYLEAQKTNTTTHDVGFMIGTPFILAWELTGEEEFRQVALTGAESLATRYHYSIGSLDAWQWGEWAGYHETIVDCMMNLKLLAWAASQPGGNTDWLDMAISHANLTAEQLIREDGSVIHIVAYERRRGTVLFKQDFGGSDVEGAVFARGQAWAIYGFTEMYRVTGNGEYYNVVSKLMNYWLEQVAPSYVPNFELSGIFPPELTAPDLSGTALVASALFELAACAPEPDREGWDGLAREILKQLISEGYFGDGPGTGLLYHQTNDFSTPTKVDTAISYGDYYLLEALIRYLNRYAES